MVNKFKLNLVFLSLILVTIAIFVMAAGIDVANLISPANNTWTSGTNDTINFAFNYTGENTSASCELFINDLIVGINATTLNDTNTILQSNTTISEGSNEWYINCTNGSTIMSDIWILKIDTVAPIINTAYPANTTYATAPTQFNYTYTEINCDKTWYSNDSGATNYSVQTCGDNFTSMIANENGANTWMVYINDTAGNVNSTSVTFTVDTTFPQLSIALPANTTYATTSLNLNYTSSDDNLDTTWYEYNDSNTTLTANTTFTALDDQQSTLILWANDTAGNVNSTSVTFTVDTTAPLITLISPADSTSSTTSAYNFTFNVTDNQSIPNCTLIFDDSIIHTLTSVNNTGGTNGMYNSSLSVTTHTWSVNCTDSVGNVGNSSTRTLIVSTATTSSSSGGGYLTYGPKAEELAQGYHKVMYKNWRISFKVENNFHIFKIESITDTSAKISISSETQEATLSVGEEKKFEISGDNYYDVLVKLNSIDTTGTNKADITIQTIHEEIISQQQDEVEKLENKETQEIFKNEDEDEKNEAISMWPWILGMIVAIFIVFSIKYKKGNK